MPSLDGRVVAITGITAGIGRATAARCAAAGASVVGCARGEERLAVVATENPGVTTVACDVRDARQRADFIAEVIDRHGRIDALVNNAGIGRIGWFADLDSSDIDDVFATNAIAVADLTRLALQHMLKVGQGDIVEMASVSGWFATPPLTVYAATKHAVTGLVQGLRAELRGTGVRIHSIDPGPVSTEFASRAAGYEPEESDAWAHEPTRFAVDPDDVAEAVERCLLAGTPQTLTLPPLAALSRVAHLPFVGSTMERAVGVVTPQLIRLGRRIANNRVPPAYRIEPKDHANA